ncbi:MAG TPA: VTT domain-containing protein [Aestuariivirgaceae bacterium]|nr:VTT domain-containing protein [Aestuariivirgaceae bacterium]
MDSPKASQNRLELSKRWGPLVLLAGVAAAIYLTGAYRYLSLASVADHRDTLQGFVQEHRFLAVAAYGMIYVATVALSLPGAVLLTVLGGFLFGWLITGPVVVVAATAGATIIFLVARTSLGDVLARRAGPRLSALARGFRDDAFSYLLFLRLAPVFPFWLVNIAPALFNVKLPTFVAATFLGIIPGTFAFAFLGSGLDSIIARQMAAYEACLAAGRDDCEMRFEAGALLAPELIIAFVALGVVALIPVVVKRVRARRGKPAIESPAESPE